MSECRVVDLKELGISKEIFDKIYLMGEKDGRVDALDDAIYMINLMNQFSMGILTADKVIQVLEELKSQSLNGGLKEQKNDNNGTN